MNRSEAKDRIEKLKKVVDRHRYLYHVLDRQEISDPALDSLKKELFDLEQEYPELITPDSPTQRVGGKPLKKFNKFRHPEAMLSFNDAFDTHDMEEWRERMVNALGGKKHGSALRSFSEEGYYCELKIDGLAIELIYKKGILAVGSTRGDGMTGEDVTQNLKTVDAIPLKLEISKYRNIEIPEELVIRGEVFITKKDFKRINKEQERRGLKIYANPRNLAAGSVRQLDPAVTGARKLDSFAYALKTDVGQVTHEEEHLILGALGFKTNPHNKFCKDLKAVNEFRNYWEEHREKLNYEIDGIVVAVNDNKIFQKLGVVGKAPRGAVAYKFAPKESQTVVEDIIVQVGRTGTLTPVAVLKPVNIGGVTVSRATLHNLDEIKRLGVKIGDTVIVGRAGDVIPDVRQVIKELRIGKEKEFHMPKKCPVCSGPVERISGQVAFRCTNKNCPAIRRETIYHFISKRAFDIDGVGPKIIDQLIEAGLIRDAADLFSLKKEDLLNLPRFADTSAHNAIDAIQAKKKITLDKFIYSLGVEHVGEETAFALAKKFKKLGSLRKSALGELESTPDVGPVVAKSVYDWFQRPYNQKLLYKFNRAGVHVLEEKWSRGFSRLAGKTFVITGSLESMTRDEAKDRVRDRGGDVSSSVSKETDYVIVGSEPGSKYDKAKKLDIKAIDEKEFLKLLS